MAAAVKTFAAFAAVGAWCTRRRKGREDGRGKLGERGAMIETLRGVGYRWKA